MPNPPLICNVNSRFTSKTRSAQTFATIFRLGEYRVDGDAGGVHDLEINVKLIQIDFSFRIGNEICLHTAREATMPCTFVIGDNNNLRAMNCFFIHAISAIVSAGATEMHAYR